MKTSTKYSIAAVLVVAVVVSYFSFLPQEKGPPPVVNGEAKMNGVTVPQDSSGCPPGQCGGGVAQWYGFNFNDDGYHKNCPIDQNLVWARYIECLKAEKPEANHNCWRAAEDASHECHTSGSVTVSLGTNHLTAKKKHHQTMQEFCNKAALHDGGGVIYPAPCIPYMTGCNAATDKIKRDDK